jgi:hypothetical protein
MEDLSEEENHLRGRRHGDRHQEGHRCRGDLLQVLDTGRRRLDTGHHPHSRGAGQWTPPMPWGPSVGGPPMLWGTPTMPWGPPAGGSGKV